MTFPAHPAWDFVTRLYGAPKVAAACLELQERHGINVTFMLFCVWRGSVGVLLPEDDMRTLATAAQAWHETIVLPVRAVRRRLKADAATGGAPDVSTLYKKVLATEVDCEHAQLLMLAAHARMPAGPRDGEGTAAAIAKNLAAFFDACSVALSAQDHQIVALLQGNAEIMGKPGR